MKKDTALRIWLMKIWTENRDEHQEFKEPVVALEEYFDRYKYWLKREFRYQQRISK